MRIIFISNISILLVSILLWLIFQVLAAYISRKVPSKWCTTNSFLFKERSWEKGGEFYSKVFKVRKWKGLLPDGAAITKNGYRKKTLTSYTRENLELYVLESCRAELAHFLAILPFWVFGLFAPAEIIIYMFIYALAFNAPCIIAQRFNRPRISKILRKMDPNNS